MALPRHATASRLEQKGPLHGNLKAHEQLNALVQLEHLVTFDRAVAERHIVARLASRAPTGQPLAARRPPLFGHSDSCAPFSRYNARLFHREVLAFPSRGRYAVLRSKA